MTSVWPMSPLTTPERCAVSSRSRGTRTRTSPCSKLFPAKRPRLSSPRPPRRTTLSLPLGRMLYSTASCAKSGSSATAAVSLRTTRPTLLGAYGPVATCSRPGGSISSGDRASGIGMECNRAATLEWTRLLVESPAMELCTNIAAAPPAASISARKMSNCQFSRLDLCAYTPIPLVCAQQSDGFSCAIAARAPTQRDGNHASSTLSLTMLSMF
eukprot:3397508-Pleurochrysis_carterae.AAC.3